MLGAGDLLGCLVGDPFSNFSVNGQKQEAQSPHYNGRKVCLYQQIGYQDWQRWLSKLGV